MLLYFPSKPQLPGCFFAKVSIKKNAISLLAASILTKTCSWLCHQVITINEGEKKLWQQKTSKIWSILGESPSSKIYKSRFHRIAKRLNASVRSILRRVNLELNNEWTNRIKTSMLCLSFSRKPEATVSPNPAASQNPPHAAARRAPNPSLHTSRAGRKHSGRLLIAAGTISNSARARVRKAA